MTPPRTSAGTVPPPAGLALRRHQGEALEALRAREAAGERRSWVVLPPGAGKTLVGVVTAADLLEAGEVSHVVVLSPNTAIQGQWLRQASAYGLDDVDDHRELEATFTSLTYQSLAVFDADDEVAEDPDDPPPLAVAPAEGPLRGRRLIDDLHPNGLALLHRMRNTRGLLLVLDECHHLLEVWGRLLAEVLEIVPDARVLGLTATPPDTLDAEQAALVDELFGEVAFASTIPAVVREGDLVPFAELAWLVEPTAEEGDWLDAQAVRFTELTTSLTDPAYGKTPFLTWLRRRFVDPVPDVVPWTELARREPELTDAALRMHHQGLLDLPAGARPLEQHRRAPTVEDWVALIEDWVGGTGDEEVLEDVREALPAVGYQWTRRGVRRGRSTTDRVLARSAAKATATADIVMAEHSTLGDRLRMLVLCDHERATATVPAALVGVLDAQTGSAVAVLEQLLADPATASLRPVLVTGRTVAGGRDTLLSLRSRVAAADPSLGERLEVVPLDADRPDAPAYRLEGPWSSRTWVRHVTEHLSHGDTQVLVGTRGLLGEGWDATCLTGLVDLTTATSLTAVVQTRGRALRVDARWPDKVAVTWTVTCVSERHPKGANDWDRLVRKHTGFFGVDSDGTVADGVAHLDGSFSPYAPPPVATFDAVNARMLTRAQRRTDIADAWRVGQPYDDRTAVAVRLTGAGVAEMPEAREPREAALTESGLTVLPGLPGTDAGARTPDRGPALGGLAAALLLLVAGARVMALDPSPLVAVGLAVVALVLVVAGLVVAGRLTARTTREEVTTATRRPSLVQVASALADGLRDAGLTERGADVLELEVTSEGEHRLLLGGVDESESALFAEALAELVAPVASPRYLVSRYVSDPPVTPRWVLPTRGGMERARRGFRPTGEAWHGVPSVLGANADRVRVFSAAWQHWVGGGRALYTGSPEGVGVLAAQAGADAFDVTTVMRRQWE